MNLEILNKLYLELSLVTTATTDREMKLRTELAHWVQLAKAQRDWWAKNHPGQVPDSFDGPCPTAAGIAASEKLLGREVGYPKG